MKALQWAATFGSITLVSAGLAFAARQTTEANTKDNKESKLIKPEAIQGCYELGALKWSPDLLRGNEDEVFITPPKQIRILSDHGTNGLEERGYLVRPAPGTTPSIHRYSYWRPTGPNSIELVFSTGTSGLYIRLKLEGDVLKGKATTFWDFLRRHQTAHVAASRIDCGKE